MTRRALLILGMGITADARAQAAAPSQFESIYPIVAIAFMLAVLVAIRATYKFIRTPTVSAYVKKFPHAHTQNGVVCAHCGSGSIFLSFVMGHYGPKRHICRGCGRTLFRS